jgi:hypothetical protein
MVIFRRFANGLGPATAKAFGGGSAVIVAGEPEGGRAMKTWNLIATLASAAGLLAATPLAAQSTVDTTGIGSLIDQAMNRSEVMQNLEYLADNIGPRLSTSRAMRKANDWTASRFQAYGLTAHLEPYEFGVPWERGTASLRLTAPFNREVTAHSWAWTEGTNGKTVGGPVVLTDLSTPESLAVYKDKVKGSWVLPRAPLPIWNPDGPEKTPADSVRLEAEIKQRNSAFADTTCGVFGFARFSTSP